MGRKTRAAATVVGATPASALPAPFPGLKGGLGLEEELRSGSSRGGREPRKLPVSRFFVAPPRTALLETADGSTGADVIKRIAKDTAAPVGLGTLSATIWGRTAASKGGARDPAAPAAKRATRIMADVAALDGSSSRELLFSTDGFRAYADDQIWGVRAPGEADDAPLDEDDVMQLRARLRELWKHWRVLPAGQQRNWADQQLAQEAAATLDRASGKAQPTKRRRGGGGVSDAAEPGSRRATKGKAVAGWSYTAPPHHAPKGAQAAAARTALRALELNELSDDDADVAGAARTSRDQGARRTGDGAAGSDIGLSAEYRRAAAMRSSRAALLAEMRTWEEDDAERDAAAAAGLTVKELRRQHKAAAAKAAADATTNDDDDAVNGDEPVALPAAAAARRGRGGTTRAADATTTQARRRTARTATKAAAAAAAEEEEEAASSEDDSEEEEEEDMDMVMETDDATSDDEDDIQQVAAPVAALIGRPANRARKPARGVKPPQVLAKKRRSISPDVAPPAKMRKQSGGGKAAATAGSGSPVRRSQRQQQAAQEEEDGPAVSGAGPSAGPSGARRGRAAAGGAKAAQLEAIEKTLFSNTRDPRRSSISRSESPALAGRTGRHPEATEQAMARPSRFSRPKAK